MSEVKVYKFGKAVVVSHPPKLSKEESQQALKNLENTLSSILKCKVEVSYRK